MIVGSRLWMLAQDCRFAYFRNGVWVRYFAHTELVGVQSYKQVMVLKKEHCHG